MNHIARLADTIKELIDNPQVLDQVMDELSDAEIVLLNQTVSAKFIEFSLDPNQHGCSRKESMILIKHTSGLHKDVTFDQEDSWTWNQWNNPNWVGSRCTVYGEGAYRVNQYGADGMAHWQHRFMTKDDMLRSLCNMNNRGCQIVEKGHPQYEVRDYYADKQPETMSWKIMDELKREEIRRNTKAFNEKYPTHTYGSQEESE